MAQAAASVPDAGTNNAVDTCFPMTVHRFIHGFEQRGHDSGNKGITASRRIDHR